MHANAAPGGTNDRAWDQRIVRDEMSRMEPLPIDAGMLSVFEIFRTHRAVSFYPVVDDHWGEPLGIVRDRDLKEHAYSIFGIEHLVTSDERLTLPRFVVRCPIADVNSKAEAVLRTFSAEPSAECIILVDQRRYVGFLSSSSLLRLMNEMSMAAARDQNPLTNLPGNSRVHDVLAAAAEDSATAYSVFWLDFDNFKPYNDKYGLFRMLIANPCSSKMGLEDAMDCLGLAWPGRQHDALVDATATAMVWREMAIRMRAGNDNPSRAVIR